MSKIFVLIIGIVIGGLLGGYGMLVATGNYDTVVSVTKSSIATCAMGQDFKLRQSVGVAQFKVNFQDNEYLKVECVSKPSKL